MICIIGHGPSPVGRGWGPRIDAQTVVRMHDWAHQPAEDYGSRCDHAVLPGPWLDRALGQLGRAPICAWWIYMLPGRRPRIPIPATVLGVPTRAIEVAIEMDAPAPTRGLCAAAMSAATFPEEEIVLVGFDTLRAGAATQYPDWYGMKIGEDRIGRSANHRHDFAAERAALAHLPRVRHAEDVWS